MVDADHPRILFLAVDRATYKPILEQPWQEACDAAAARIPGLMAAKLADNLAHIVAKMGGTRMAALAPGSRTWHREATPCPGSRTWHRKATPWSGIADMAP
ncbi:hypothetical protein MKK55_08625 [Methylobacterium sp. J-059]|uniref:hypothetical protein n=1 Tax=Methylobacterium sp. J-059 TaxID=2836643 RepID=UPI001FBB57BB|nr:hypothetical protein [Methylobacterium sp. J-059]MCJ2039017.1 hypothetical protein [Methylobacterium sp. J-059]